MKLKPEQIKELQGSLEEALNYMLPHFLSGDLAKFTNAMEGNIGIVDFPDGRTANIIIRVEIASEAEHEEKNS